MPKLYSIEEACESTTLTSDTLRGIIKRGFVNYSYVKENFIFVEKRLKVSSQNIDGEVYLEEKVVSALIDIEHPAKIKWPTISQLSKGDESFAKYIHSRYRKGEVRGQKAISDNKSIRINPEDVDILLVPNGKRFTIDELIQKTSIAYGTIYCMIATPTLYFSIPGKGKVEKKLKIDFDVYRGSRLYSEESFRNLMLLNRPVLLNWVTNKEFAEKYSEFYSVEVIRKYFANGTITAQRSVTREELHFPLHEAKRLLKMKKYSVKNLCEELGVSRQTVHAWNKHSKSKVIKKGIGNNSYIEPYIYGRLKKIKQQGNVQEKYLRLITETPNKFFGYLKNPNFKFALEYSHRNPFSVDDCKIGDLVDFGTHTARIKIISEDKYRPFFRAETVNSSIMLGTHNYMLGRSNSK